MNTFRRWITLLLLLVTIILIGWNLADRQSSPTPVTSNTQEPTYTSQTSDTAVYNPEGKLSYKLRSEEVTYFSADATSWFEHPVMTTYDENQTATWSVKSDKARLTNDKMLYLYGHVVVNSLTETSQLKQIKTDNAIINLVTQDVTSDDEVTLYGSNFGSSGLKMRGNLRNKTAELIEKVKTSYEIENKP
ncbi:MAG: Lipopolysaccharide export system protein LptC [Candidatus Erwinia impunctatus]|nr:Lipopolysaccharide export system protein LptC [Culicoides impunctatus]